LARKPANKASLLAPILLLSYGPDAGELVLRAESICGWYKESVMIGGI
jgi:hypothetical protein